MRPFPQAPFGLEVRRLLLERKMSLRALARQAGVDPSHLSRVLRGAAYKSPSVDLIRRVASALDVSPQRFPEFRQGIVLKHVRGDPAFRDRLYAELTADLDEPEEGPSDNPSE